MKENTFFRCSASRGAFSAVLTAVVARYGVAVVYACPGLRRSGLGSPFSQRPIRLGPQDSRPRHFCIIPRPTAGGAHPVPAEGTTDGGSAGAGGGHTRKRQVDVDVLALLREWELEDESERLAENGVCKMKDLESMNEMDMKEFGCRLGLLRKLLQHVAKQKENKRASDGSKEHKVHYLIKLGQYAEVKHLMLQLWRALVSWLPVVGVSVILSWQTELEDDLNTLPTQYNAYTN